jgi:hypothetical protein
MDRVAKLVVAAEDLRRRVWASLPWGVRLAELYIRLAASSQEAFGNPIYAIFLLAGTKGMPNISGKTAEEFMAEFNAKYGEKDWNAKFKLLSGKLPSNYGADLGKRIFAKVLANSKSTAKAEDIMSKWLMRFMTSGHKGLEEGGTLSRAENYVFKGVMNDANSAHKSPSNRERSMDQRNEDGEETEFDIPTSAEVEDLGKILPEGAVHQALKDPKLIRELEKAHEDAPLYVKMVLTDGLDDKSIVGDPRIGLPSKLPHPFNSQGKPLTPQSWDMTYKKKIMHALRDYFESNPPTS